MTYHNESVTYLFNDITAHINEEHTHRLAIVLLLLVSGLPDVQLKDILEMYAEFTQE